MSTIARIYRAVASSLRTLARDRQNAKPRDWAVGLIVGWLGLNVIADLASPQPQPAQPRGFMATAEATEAEVEQPTDEPTEAATATDEPTATEAASETPEPTAAPTDTPVPTAVPPTAAPAIPDLNPDEDRDCDEFATREQAQAYWEHHRTGDRPNPGRLDGNSNGIVCEDPDRSPAVVAPAPQPAAPVAPPAPASGCINVNTASFDELKQIIHIDDDRAQQIIDQRQARPFRGWNDFQSRIKGIGDARRRDIEAEGKACIQ